MVPFMLDWTLTNTKSFSYPHEGLVSLFIHFAQFNVKKSGTFNSSFHCAFNQRWKRKLHLQGKRWKVGIARRVIRVINMFCPSKAAYTESWVLLGFVGLSIVPLSHCFRIGNFPKYTCGWRCDEFITSLIVQPIFPILSMVATSRGRSNYEGRKGGIRWHSLKGTKSKDEDAIGGWEKHSTWLSPRRSVLVSRGKPKVIRWSFQVWNYVMYLLHS